MDHNCIYVYIHVSMCLITTYDVHIVVMIQNVYSLLHRDNLCYYNSQLYEILLQIGQCFPLVWKYTAYSIQCRVIVLCIQQEETQRMMRKERRERTKHSNPRFWAVFAFCSGSVRILLFSKTKCFLFQKTVCSCIVCPLYRDKVVKIVKYKCFMVL